MALCDENDINRFLDGNKVSVSNTDDVDEIRDAEAIIRASLSGVIDSSVMALWLTPSATPEIIRSIAGRLCAAMRYAKLVSEDSEQLSSFAQSLYDQAMSMLAKIQNGTLIIPELATTELSFDENNYYPTFQTGIDNPNEAPQFDWNRQF